MRNLVQSYLYHKKLFLHPQPLPPQKSPIYLSFSSRAMFLARSRGMHGIYRSRVPIQALASTLLRQHAAITSVSNSFNLLPSRRTSANVMTTKRGLRTKPIKELPIPKHERRLDVVIFGKPNSGKSVLLNALVKEKVAATSRKKHTTRGEIIGVYNHRNVQLAFFDTPGFVSIKESNQSDVQTLGKMATSSLKGADVVLLVVDASGRLTDNVKDTFAEMVGYAVKHAKTELILVLNKVDLVEPKKRLLDITYELVSLINGVKLPPDQINNASLDTTTFMVSALENDGVEDIKNYLLTLSKPKEWLVPRNKGITMLGLKDRVREAVLEALLDNTHQEVPYISDIYCRNISDLPQKEGAVSKPKRRFDVSIVVDAPGQQRIVVGQQGRTLLSIRQLASSILEEMFKDYTVILFLYIEIAGKEKKNDELLNPFDDGEIIVYNNEDNDGGDDDVDNNDLSSSESGNSASNIMKRIRGVSASDFDDINEVLQHASPKDIANEEEDERKFQEYVKTINMEEFIKENVVVKGNLEDPDAPGPVKINNNNAAGKSGSRAKIPSRKSKDASSSEVDSSINSHPNPRTGADSETSIARILSEGNSVPKHSSKGQITDAPIVVKKSFGRSQSENTNNNSSNSGSNSNNNNSSDSDRKIRNSNGNIKNSNDNGKFSRNSRDNNRDNNSRDNNRDNNNRSNNSRFNNSRDSSSKSSKKGMDSSSSDRGKRDMN